jgi:ubiquitin-protein ligase
MSSGRALAIKRINKDMKEIVKSPIEGIGIVSIDNDPMKYVVNLRLMQGPYEGYCLQLLLTFTDNYPTRPPKILIFPNQAISGEYHHHIFNDSNGFKKFCFDLLDNDFMSISEEHTGWNPSYSISSLLLQVQNFIADPDLHGFLPSKEKINQLMNSMKDYEKIFKIKDGNKEIEIVHTWENPYPEKSLKKLEIFFHILM